MSFSQVFGDLSMKDFARVMSLLFGSAGAHTYPKSGQDAPSLHIRQSSITVHVKPLFTDKAWLLISFILT